MTPEQQRLVRYAKAMGWKRDDKKRGPGYFSFVMSEVYRLKSGLPQRWNPLIDANDALELAEKMEVTFARRGPSCYWAHYRKDGQHAGSVRADTLPAAICAAVDAALEAKE